MMSEAPDPRATSDRIEHLLADLAAHGDPRVAERAEEVVRLLMELYGAALHRVMTIVAAEPPEGPATETPAGSSAGPALVDRLADDQLIASLLILHGLHPLDTGERVRRALDTVRPYLGSHAGGVQLLGVDDDVVRLRLEGSCDGCPSSTVTIKNAIERAIGEAAPEITAVEVEGAAEPHPASSSVIPVEALYRDRPAPGNGTPAAGAPAAGAAANGAAASGAGTWTTLPDVSDLGHGELRGLEVAGNQVLICRTDGNLYAYLDYCPACGSPMAGGELDGELAGCPSCRRGYNVRLAGRSADDRDVHLDPLPLIIGDGETRICVPGAAVAS
jgi:Fe-S cluster biogenesis protein NfuA/nitrite reductase/ring-hydroxylating ferredoxin subunit